MSDRVLVDSSAWSDYLRGRDRNGAVVLRLVAEDRVWLHPTVSPPAEDVVDWIRRQDPARLRGVGWADCAIAHAAVTLGVPLVTSDTAQAALFASARR